MIRKKIKTRTIGLIILGSLLYAPLMMGVTSNNSPRRVHAVDQTTIWEGPDTNAEILYDESPEKFPQDNSKCLVIELDRIDNISIYDYELNDLQVVEDTNCATVEFSDDQWKAICTTGGIWIFADDANIIKVSYKEKEATTNYDLWIAGVQVTSENKDNILDGEGTASYDPATYTLTLDNISIMPEASGSSDASSYGEYLLKDIGIVSKIEDLTINVTNSVSIGKQHESAETVDAYEFKLGVVSTGDITITGPGKFFVFGGMGSLAAENVTINMDFGDEGDDSQLFMESLCHLEEGHENDYAGTVLVTKDFSLLSGCVDINCSEQNSILSIEGDVTVKDSQLELEAGHDCILIENGNLLIDNSLVSIQSEYIGMEIHYKESGENGNTTIQNNSVIYQLVTENATTGIQSYETIVIDNSRFFVFDYGATAFQSALETLDFIMTGDSLLYSNTGLAAVSFEGPTKINITGGTVITNTMYGLYGGGETDGLFVVGSEATPFAVKNGARYDDETDTFIPVDVCDGVMVTPDVGYAYMSNIGPASSEVNDGFVEINTYASVSMEDYEYGDTVSEPSLEHNIIQLWGIDVEEATIEYYADGESIDDAEIWENIEPETLDVGTYYMVAHLTDNFMPLFEYYTDPVKFEVTTSGPSLVAKPAKDETTFTYTGEEQTYVIEENDLYTISDNVQTNAGNYTVTVSLNDKDNYSWADGSTDDLEYSFVIEKAKVTKPDADTTEFIYTGEDQTYSIAKNDLYQVSDNVKKDAGQYTVTISLKDKANYSWADGSTDDLEYDFVIAKAQQVIEISDLGKVYDANSFYFNEKNQYTTTNYFTKLGDGIATVEYKLVSEDDSKYTTTAPVDAGNYTIRVSVAEGSNYLSSSVTKDFTIDYAKISKVGFGDIAQPVAGEEAPTTAKGIAIGSRYSGTISWDKNLVDGKFDYNTVYTATVTLDIVPTSAANYRFADNVTLVKPTEGWTKSADSTGTKLVYTKTFEKTEKIPQIISITNDISKTYDNTAVNAPTYTKVGDGAVTIEYKLAGADDSTYTTTAPVNAGKYVVRVSVAGTDTNLGGSLTKEFTIEKVKVTKPTADSSTFIYNGEDQTYNIASSDLYTITNNVQKNAGTYSVSVSLNDKTNYEWADGTIENLSFDFEINKIKVAKPTADSSTFIYNGEDQTYNIASSDFYTVAGNVANEIGAHKVTVSLIDTNNCEWEDGTIANLSFDFVIAKDACVNHWILIGILVLGLALVAVMLFVVKNELIGSISSAVFLLASIVASIFCACVICVVFAVVDIVAFTGSSIMFVLKIVSNKEKKKTDEEDKPKTKKAKKSS